MIILAEMTEQKQHEIVAETFQSVTQKSQSLPPFV